MRRSLLALPLLLLGLLPGEAAARGGGRGFGRGAGRRFFSSFRFRQRGTRY